MPYDRRALVGIGGWLAFFIITLCLNAVAVLFVTIATLFSLPAALPGAGWSAYVGIVALVGVAKFAAYGFMAWRLNARQEAATPPLVVKLLWAVAVVPALVEVVAGAALLGTGASIAYTLGASMGRPLLYAGIWTAYLLRSERVANTYAEGDADRLAAVFD